MADRGVDLSALPKEVRDQLAELDLELSEGNGGVGREGGPPGEEGCYSTYSELAMWLSCPGRLMETVWFFPRNHHHHPLPVHVYCEMNGSTPALELVSLFCANTGCERTS